MWLARSPPLQISAAYKRLTRLYHPDKHRDPESKRKADALFAKLKLAHEGDREERKETLSR